MKNVSKTVRAALCGAAVAFVVTAAAAYIIFYNMGGSMRRLNRVESLIEKSYIGEYDKEKAEDAAINSLIECTGDRYAMYYDQEDAESTFDRIEGYYIGIGMEIMADTENDCIVVVSAYEDTPAYRAGIKSGDVIKTIDGKRYGANELSEASKYMQGKEGGESLEKAVEIVIARGESELNFSLKREKIGLYRVKSEISPDNIAYINYSGFTQNSEKELEKIVKGLPDSVVGIVLDLRNNPGGEFQSAIEMCDLFLEKGKDIMYTVDKSGKKTVYTAKKGGCSLPLAVIVNESSASAAEIFAGSMQSNGRAVIVGRKTFGKGVSQTVRYINPLDKKMGALRLTTCKNYTPDGRWLNESVIPDIEITNGDTAAVLNKDDAYNAAVDSLLKKEQK